MVKTIFKRAMPALHDTRELMAIAVYLATVLVAAIALVIATSTMAWSRDLGAIGPVYPIAEPDMIEEIQAKLRQKEASGELADIEAKARARMQAQIETPAPVKGLRRAQVARAYHVDPSVRFEQAIYDDKGRVVVPAGTLANPLSVVTMNSTWLLFDARDPKQVALAKAEIDASRQPVKPILVGGSPAALMREWKRPVFFDQNGQIVQRFGIEAVPARIRQDGQVLLIEEFPPQ